MAGISSKAIGKTENRFKFNDGTERTTDLGVNLDETDFRSYDAQIGRFLQMDPLESSESWSPYAYVQDNPIFYCDPLGLDTTRGSKIDGKPKDNDVWINGDAVRIFSNGKWYDQNALQGVVVTPTSNAEANAEDDDSNGTNTASTGTGTSNTPSNTPAPAPKPAPPTPVVPPKPAPPTPVGTKTLYLDIALKYEGAEYSHSVISPKAYDCSGLICLVTGHPGKDHVWSTQGKDAPPGNWTRVYPSASSYNKWLGEVVRGDLFVWRNTHTAFYTGDGRIYGAHDFGKPSGYSKPTALQYYWIPNKGYPEVWRQK